MSDNLKVLLIGTGNMAFEYYKILDAMGIKTVVVGRSEERAIEFKEKTGCADVYYGGIQNIPISNINDITHAIVAVTVSQLKTVTLDLIKKGIHKILVEKPGALNKKDLIEMQDEAVKTSTTVYIAYNRRFYSSVYKAEEIIKADGGVKSFNFEFTEWGHVIEKTNHDIETKSNWLLANSSHVIDLAFYLGGEPVEMYSFVQGELDWHKNGSNYVGAGKTESGALFNYCANWDAPGRWSVEILTSEHRLYLKPMEKLFIQERGSVQVNLVELDDMIDVDFKPGLYKETQAFLDDNNTRLVELDEQILKMNIYEKIAGID